MMNLFRLQAAAHVAENPKIVELDSGKTVCNVNMIVNRKAYDREQDEMVEIDPVWIACEFWGKKSKVAYSLLEVGDLVIFEGVPDSYAFKTQDSEDKLKSTLTCKVSDFTVNKNRKNKRFSRREK